MVICWWLFSTSGCIGKLANYGITSGLETTMSDCAGYNYISTVCHLFRLWNAFLSRWTNSFQEFQFTFLSMVQDDYPFQLGVFLKDFRRSFSKGAACFSRKKWDFSTAKAPGLRGDLGLLFHQNAFWNDELDRSRPLVMLQLFQRMRALERMGQTSEDVMLGVELVDISSYWKWGISSLPCYFTEGYVSRLGGSRIYILSHSWIHEILATVPSTGDWPGFCPWIILVSTFNPC